MGLRRAIGLAVHSVLAIVLGARCSAAAQPRAFLNADGFKPPPFQPNPNVVDFHSSLLFRETNVIAIPPIDLCAHENCTDDEFWAKVWASPAPAAQDYWEGVGTFPFLLVAVFPMWAVIVCCLGPLLCGRCTYRKRSTIRLAAFVAFSACCLSAVVAWSASFRLNSDLKEVLLRSRDRLASAHHVASDLAPAIAGAVAHLGNLSVSVAALVDVCPLGYSSAVDAAASPTVTHAQRELAHVAKVLPHAHTALRALDDVLPHADVHTKFSSSLLLTISLFLWLATALQYRNPGGATCLRVKTCMARASCVSAFTVGAFFVFLSLVIAALAHGVATVGADVCSGNPDAVIQALLAQGFDSATLQVKPASGVAVCEAAPHASKAQAQAQAQAPPDKYVQLLCFYQTCAGETALGEALASLDALATGEAPLPAPPANASAACGAVAAEVAARAHALDAPTQAIAELLRCSRINPIYTSLLHESVCGELVTVIISGWDTFVVGSVTLLAALVLYRHFYLFERRDYDFRKLPKSGSKYWETTTNHADAGEDEDDLPGVPAAGDPDFHGNSRGPRRSVIAVAEPVSLRLVVEDCGKLVDDGSFGVQFATPSALPAPAPASAASDVHVSLQVAHL